MVLPALQVQSGTYSFVLVGPSPGWSRSSRLAQCDTNQLQSLHPAALLAAVAAGDLRPSEAADIGKLVDSYLQSIEATEFEKRLSRIEKGNNDEEFSS